MKKSKYLSRIVALLLALVMSLSMAACGNSGSGGPEGNAETMDTERTQLFIHNFNGGYGVEWLKNLKDR